MTRVSVISASAPSCFSQSVVLVRHCAIVSQSISGPLCKHAASSSFFLLPNCYQSNQPLSHLARIEKIAPTEKKKCLFCLFFFSGEEKFLVNTSRHHTDGAGGSLSGGLPVKGEECDTAELPPFRYRHTREVMNVNVLLLLSLTKLIWHCSSAAISTMSSSDNN